MNDTTDTNRTTGREGAVQDKKVFLVAAFRQPDLADGSQADKRRVDDGPADGAADVPDGGPATGMAEDVVAVIGMAGGSKRFAWVGDDQNDSIANPALVTPVKVRLALPSPWHPERDNIVTGLVQLAPDQLGAGSIDDDVDHLLAELATSRGTPPPASAADRSQPAASGSVEAPDLESPDRAPAADRKIVSR